MACFAIICCERDRDVLMKKFILFFVLILSLVVMPIVKAENTTEFCKEEITKIAPGGVLTLNAVKPINKNYSDVLWALGIKSNIKDPYIKNKNISDIYVGLSDCNESLDECNFYFKIAVDTEDVGVVTVYEKYPVTVHWNPSNYNPKIKTAVESFVANMESNIAKSAFFGNGRNIASYTLSDINYFKYWVYNYDLFLDSNYDFTFLTEQALNFIPEYKNDSLNYNVDLKFSVDGSAGSTDGEPFVSAAESSYYSLWYKDTLYLASSDVAGEKGTAQFLSAYPNEVIYVPDDTADNSDALIAAAKKRIADELPGYEFNFEEKGNVCEYLKGDYLDNCNVDDNSYLYFLKGVDLTKLNYFEVTYKDVTKDFLIIRDSSKMKTNNNKVSQDFDTDIKVETSANDVPDDIKIQVDEVEDSTDKYDKIKEKIDSEFEAYDISLLSGSLKGNVTKTDGKFKVSIPIPNKLKGKKLAVYYINDNGEIEEYKLNTVNNVGSFETNHFSTYILAEVIDNSSSSSSSSSTPSYTDNVSDEETSKPVDSEEVPDTLDNSIIYFIMCIISLIGIVANTLYLNKLKD